jgi:hypothetical protein
MAAGTKRQISVESHRITKLVVYEVAVDDLNQLERETLSIPEDLSFGIFAGQPHRGLVPTNSA